MVRTLSLYVHFLPPFFIKVSITCNICGEVLGTDVVLGTDEDVRLPERGTLTEKTLVLRYGFNIMYMIKYYQTVVYYNIVKSTLYTLNVGT